MTKSHRTRSRARVAQSALVIFLIAAMATAAPPDVPTPSGKTPMIYEAIPNEEDCELTITGKDLALPDNTGVLVEPVVILATDPRYATEGDHLTVNSYTRTKVEVLLEEFCEIGSAHV